MKLYKEFYFPDYDTQCHPAVFKELWKIDEVMQHVKHCGVAVQAGANTGLFAVELAKYFDTVLTCEPDIQNYQCLVKNLSIHDSSNISAYCLGLGDKPAKANIYQPDNSGNCGSLAVEESEDGQVNITTIDSLVENENKVDLIYLDIEGYEYKALMGAKETIERDRPVLVLENKGLIPEFELGFKGDGCSKFRSWVEDTFNYRFERRLMRDDILLPNWS